MPGHSDQSALARRCMLIHCQSMRIILAPLLAVLAVSVGQAQNQTPPDDKVIYANEFLTIGVGARAQALGNSTVASSTDIFSTYWNPAGLVDVDSTTGLIAGAMHAEQFAGNTKFDYLGISLPIASGGRRFGVSLIRQGTDDVPNTLNLIEPDGTVNYDNVTLFSVADYAMLFSYAQPTQWLKGRVSVGGNLKIIRRIIGDFSKAWGVGADIGLRYADGPFRAGLVLRDATSTFSSWKTELTDAQLATLQQTGNTLPDASGSEVARPTLLPSATYRFGFGRFGFAPEATALITFDGKRNAIVQSDNISMDLAAGLELDFQQKVFARFGVDQFQYIRPLGEEEKLSPRFALGLGVQLKRFSLDYAFSNPGNGEDLYAHVVSLDFGLTKPAR